MKSPVNKPRGAKRVVMILGLLLLLVLLLGGGFLFIAPFFETDDNVVVEGSENWMAGLPDHLKLNEITIPGAHNAGAVYSQMAYFTKCQSKNILAQLKAGFRYLDVRLSISGEKMLFTHGSYQCKKDSMLLSSPLYLENVLETCRSFLSDHPTETILFAVKQEHGEESVADFQKLLSRHINAAPSFWLLTDRFPTLEEARGKLVLLRRYADEAQLGEEAGIPLIWEDQGSRDDTSLHIAAQNNGFYTLYVQDRYSYQTEEKWTAFTSGLSYAQEQAASSDQTLSLHFLSTHGPSVLGHPFAFAKALNERLLTTAMPADPGWILVDFGTAPLAERIYRLNSLLP